MAYIEAITPQFKAACENAGLIRRGRTGRNGSFKIDFEAETNHTTFKMVSAAAYSFQDIMVCWKWVPRHYEPILIRRLLALKERGRLTAEQEFQAWQISPPGLWELSPKAREVQKNTCTNPHQRT